MAQMQKKSGNGSMIGLVTLAIALVAGYVALDFYAEGEKIKTVVETRGTQFIEALYRYRRETGKYPDSLERLVPGQLHLLPRCPGGEPYEYNAGDGEYRVSCPKIGFKVRPYGYDSRARVWQDL